MNIRMAVLDIGGTTVHEEGAVVGAFRDALVDVGYLEDIDEEDLDPDIEDVDLDDDSDDIVDDEEEDDEDVVVKPASRARARTADDADEEEEDEESDDVEADLDTILKDRLASHDDEDDEDEQEEAPIVITDDGELPQRKEFEFPCPSCFLLVNAKSVRRTGNCPQCGDPIEVPAGIG